MKKLSIEEKAKAYDEAIKYAHYLINERCKDGTDGSFHRADLDKMFPVLKESEDEMIRKEIIQSIKDSMVVIHKDKCIAWLEKQGKNNMGISEATKQKLEDSLSKALEKETSESLNTFLDEQKPAETEKGIKRNEREIPNSAWSEEDEKIIKTMCKEGDLKPSEKVWLKSLKDKSTWKPSDEQMKAIGHICDGNYNVDLDILDSIYRDFKKLMEG